MNSFQDNIGQPTGCPSTPKIVYMGIAADCEYTGNYGSTQNATQQIITNLNTASALYKSTFNVSLGIVELAVQDPVYIYHRHRTLLSLLTRSFSWVLRPTGVQQFLTRRYLGILPVRLTSP